MISYSKRLREAELRLRERNLEKKDGQINALERRFNAKIPPEARARFRLSNGHLQFEKSLGEFVTVTKSNGEFLAESTMRTRLGASLAREHCSVSRRLRIDQNLGLEFWFRRYLPSWRWMISLPERLERGDKRGVEGSCRHQHRPRHARVFRNRQGLDEDQRRELENNAGKLTEIDEHITREKRRSSRKSETLPICRVA